MRVWRDRRGGQMPMGYVLEDALSQWTLLQNLRMGLS